MTTTVMTELGSISIGAARAAGGRDAYIEIRLAQPQWRHQPLKIPEAKSLILELHRAIASAEGRTDHLSVAPGETDTTRPVGA